MTWLCGLRVSLLLLVACFLAWTGFLVGYVRGRRAESRRLRRRLQIVGSRFADDD